MASQGSSKTSPQNFCFRLPKARVGIAAIALWGKSEIKTACLITSAATPKGMGGNFIKNSPPSVIASSFDKATADRNFLR
ncbi:MAG: hypothetical protein JWM16_3669 [Verrucomicrobiales bacterium]|nr:hypothetical protein [Verrucomicrobiales bacterium]